MFSDAIISCHHYTDTDKEVKRGCARDKQHWYDSKASEVEEAATKGDHKSLYRIVKELTDQRTQSQQIKIADGRFARSHDELVNRWKDHFQGPDLQRILRQTYDSAALTPDLRRACELRAINKKS